MSRGRAVTTRLAWLLAVPAAAAQQPYVDRVLDDGPQPVLKAETELSSSSGWARSWRVDYSIARDTGANANRSQSLGAQGFLETPNHGSFSLNAALSDARNTPPGAVATRARSDFWRIDQSALPLDGGWLGFHSIGQLNTVQAPLTRGFGRVSLPGSAFEGVSAQYTRDDESQYSLSVGKPGTFTGLGVGGFETGGGRLTFAGAQHNLQALAPGWVGAVQWADGQDLQEFGGRQLSTRGLFASARWRGQAPWAAGLTPGARPIHQRPGGLELQVSALQTATRFAAAPGETDATGAWVDARWRTTWLENHAGVLYLEPGLRWGTFQAVSDLQGFYWRSEMSTRQWFLSGAVESTESVSGSRPRSSFYNVTTRYRIDTRDTLLASLALRRGVGAGESLALGFDRRSEWGQTQWRLDALRSQEENATRLTLDHSFALAEDQNLAVTLAYEKFRQSGRRGDGIIWGIVGGLRPASGVTLTANLRGSSSDLNRSLNGSVDLAWVLDANWSLIAQFSHSRGQDVTPLVIVSPIGEAIEAVTPPAFRANRVQLTLRYQDRAGQSYAPIGGRPGTGFGTVAGYVFFDGNDNGRREASEAGVADVLIRIDGRFVTRTDAQGRYEFPAVAAGAHRLEIIPDNVPLPWSPVDERAADIDVRLRATTSRDFPLRRGP